MDVVAYNSAVTPASQVTLGAIAQQIWTQGFRRSQERAIQVSWPINAIAPNVFDRKSERENFSFACGQSFSALGDALIFMATQPSLVPHLAHLSFTQGSQTVWLGNAGISRVELIEKKSNLVIFGYTVVGGAWSKNKPF